MSDDITPALTAEEWAEKTLWLHGADTGPSVAITDHGVVEIDNDDYYTRWHATLTSRAHGVAAFCLYGKPYGFTKDDLIGLCALSQKFDQETQVFLGYRNVDRAEFLRSLADRIAALLPP